MSESETDLRDALRQSLEERGVLPGIKSQLRLEILKSLKSPEASKGPQPQYESEDNFLLNELIKEYFSWNGYLHASKVLSEESGHPSADLSRTQLEEALTLQSGPNGRKATQESALFQSIQNIIQRGTRVLILCQKPWTSLLPLKDPHLYSMISFAYPPNLNAYIAALLFEGSTLNSFSVVIDYYYPEISLRQFTKILSTSSELANRCSNPVILRCRGDIFRDMSRGSLKKWTPNIQIDRS